MIGVGLLLFFLIPGLLAYAALYGLFHSGRSIAPEPPGVNTIEASLVILLCSALVHAATALSVAGLVTLCDATACSTHSVSARLDPYALAFDAVERQGIGAGALGGLLLLALAQGGAAYALVRLRLRRLARSDRLPAWLYGWARDIANAADDDDRIVVAHVLTAHEVDGRAVIYGGALFDLGLRVDGGITRLALWDCERYVADLADVDARTLGPPMSRLPFLVIEGSQVRNVVFRIVDVPAPDAAPPDVAPPPPRPTSPA